jgi:hypothetical protein
MTEFAHDVFIKRGLDQFADFFSRRIPHGNVNARIRIGKIAG